MAKTTTIKTKPKLAIHGGKPVRSRMPAQRVLTDDSEMKLVRRVIESGQLTSLSNPIVEEFEKKFADKFGARHAIAVNSGTAALHVAFAALGIGPGDEVIVPPYTFIATASSVLQQNAVPVFADIDPETLNISPEEIEKKTTPRTRAIVPVHLFGLPADMAPILRIAKKRRIPVVEDACQSHGAVYKKKFVGTMGELSCFSFQESKNMATGEGGMILTDDKKLDEQCRVLRHIGMRKRYEYITLGYNYRLPAMSAAVGLAQLKKLDRFNKHRRMMAETYRSLVGGLPLRDIPEPAGYQSAHHLFPVILEKRFGGRMGDIVAALTAENVPVWWVYPTPLCDVDFIRKQEAYPKQCPFACPHRGAKKRRKKDDCPVATDIAARTLVLPTQPCFDESVARDTVAALTKVLEHFDS